MEGTSEEHRVVGPSEEVRCGDECRLRQGSHEAAGLEALGLQAAEGWSPVDLSARITQEAPLGPRLSVGIKGCRRSRPRGVVVMEWIPALVMLAFVGFLFWWFR